MSTIKPEPGRPSPIADALDQNEEAAEEVRNAADELAIVHGVLDTKLSQNQHDAEVRKAIADAEKVAKQLDETAEKLDEAQKTLQRELGHS